MKKPFSNVISIRKLAALDVSLNGWIFITSEFFFGVFGLMALGILFFETFMGFYFFLVSFNYIPLLIYVLHFRNQENANKEARAEISRLKMRRSEVIRKYNHQQLMVFIPFTIIILSILQEIQNF